jgi:outer membrane receptor protein involved in Fe transport
MKQFFRPACCFAATVLLAVGQTPLAAQTSTEGNDRRVEGVVLDQQGLPVPGARISLTLRGESVRTSVTTSSERFRIEGLAPGQYDLRVEVAGFVPRSLDVDLRGDSVTDIEVRVEPAGITEQVVVTATRSEQRLGDVPASVSVVRSDEIEQSPAAVADDVLRGIPTFSLFRRSSSLSSHPTTQGVSLRGIGPSGVSRTLVLLDGVPFNDPFGGWVYWTRVPLGATDRIEVVDGSSSSLYGNYAMGGVINIVTSAPRRRTIELQPQYGNLTSPKLDYFASDVWGKFGAAVEGSVFDTDGFPVVVPSERGLIDTKATVDFRNVNVKLAYDPSNRVNTFFRWGYFNENRDNAKVSTVDGTGETNDTTWKSASGGVRIQWPSGGDLEARLFGDVETFHGNFIRVVPGVTPPRSVGRMFQQQTVPTDAFGGMVQWSKAFSESNYFTAGTDWRTVDGDSREDDFDSATGLTVTVARVSGGTQRSFGAFVQDLLTPIPRLTLTLVARLDRWRNFDGHNLETTVSTGEPTRNNNPALPERDDTVVNPRIAAIYHVTDFVSVWGDWGRGFRAPTLNELYRQFSTGGTVLTLPNNQLGPERLTGGEAGVNVKPTRDVTWRLTWFDNRIRDAVGNVTVSQVGANVTQQRQNIGRTHVRGFQTDVEYRFASSFRVTGAYLYNRATVVENPANPALVGKFLPQVPEHRGTVDIAYSNPRYVTVALGVQMVGRQFDDDLNSRVVPEAALADAGYEVSTDPGLPGYTLVDLMASRPIGRNFDVFVGAQNLFDQEYFVGTLPTTIGSPRLVRGGIRVRWAGR